LLVREVLPAEGQTGEAGGCTRPPSAP
jgi:hypothetical protein